MAHKPWFLWIALALCDIYAATEFDLKTYERSLKPEIPWSLTGSAKDLRSDAKHQLQLILRTIVLLRPDAPWSAQQPKPTTADIEAGFKALQDYLAQPDNALKRPWVQDSIAYMLNVYVPKVQKLLDAPDVSSLPESLAALVEQKKQLLMEFSKSIQAYQSALVN